ncbi:Metallo-hydrolase/oxidoreductase [Zopfochytrium polystomum]|nr:Metallo-hydrolase/oxidoreductase [Zopfochytrium polystomum]
MSPSSSQLEPVVTDNADGTVTHSLFEPVTCTWTHVVAHSATNLAVIIDPVLDYDLATGAISTKFADAILRLVQDRGFTVNRIIETHAHADHLTAAQYLKKNLGGGVPVCIGAGIKQVQAVVKERYALDPASFAVDGSQFDHLFHDGDSFPLGPLTCTVLHTPGHTPDSNSYVIGAQVYCGDTIFAPDVGSARCDFPGGKASDLFASITRKLLALPPETRIYIGHDYPPGPARSAPVPFATVKDQLDANKHVKQGTVETDFTTWRTERDSQLGQPRLMHASLQANAAAGNLPAFFKTPVKHNL